MPRRVVRWDGSTPFCMRIPRRCGTLLKAITAAMRRRRGGTPARGWAAPTARRSRRRCSSRVESLRAAQTGARNEQGHQPYDDPVAYGNGPDDAIDPVGETQAVTHHVLALAGRRLVYTANAGHLVTADQVSSQPNAAFFYVAFTLDGQAQAARPVTFFYNGGPGSSSVFLLLGSFAPRRIHTAMPDFTPPAPYRLEDNPDTLFDKSDLVFINPV